MYGIIDEAEPHTRLFIYELGSVYFIKNYKIIFIIVFGCDKNINIQSQLSRIGVSCLSLDIYEEFIKKCRKKD